MQCISYFVSNFIFKFYLYEIVMHVKLQIKLDLKFQTIHEIKIRLTFNSNFICSITCNIICRNRGIQGMYIYVVSLYQCSVGLLFTPTSSATPPRPNHIILTCTIAILITIVDRVITSYPPPDQTAAAPPFLNHFFDQRLSDLV